MTDLNLAYIPLTVICLILARKIFIRLRLSRAKHPSLRGHSKMARRVAKQLKYFEYDESHFYNSDGAPDVVAKKRQVALSLLTQKIQKSTIKTSEFSQSMASSISDVDFTSAHKVPFPYRKLLAKELKVGLVCEESSGVKVKDLDGNWYYDLSGSYGVNVFGYDFYKECMAKGIEKVQALGPVLGAYHPVIKENVDTIKSISNKDEVSFHMSGTEAVMQAVRLARYHTGRSHLVRFCGSYHGWWDGVQVGIGNQRKTDDVYTLADMSENSLNILATRNDIACVLINPMQAFHPNQDAPGDATLIGSTRSSDLNREQYSLWLKQIRDVCTRRNIVLIFDEVFTGFRLAKGGAQEYFSINADMVTYGKTLGGGFPIGAVCGSHQLMKRFKEDAPANISFARGTFNSHPYVMGAMSEFLQRIQTPAIERVYANAELQWVSRVNNMNKRLQDEGLPIYMAHMHSVLSVQYTAPSRYNWMLQFYLRAHGLELSWTGTGRFIMSLAYTDQDFNEVVDKFIAACKQMQADGWWWQGTQLSNKTIKRMMLVDVLKARFPILNSVFSSDSYTHVNNTEQRGQSL